MKRDSIEDTNHGVFLHCNFPFFYARAQEIDRRFPILDYTWVRRETANHFPYNLFFIAKMFLFYEMWKVDSIVV